MVLLLGINMIVFFNSYIHIIVINVCCIHKCIFVVCVNDYLYALYIFVTCTCSKSYISRWMLLIPSTVTCRPLNTTIIHQTQFIWLSIVHLNKANVFWFKMYIQTHDNMKVQTLRPSYYVHKEYIHIRSLNFADIKTI